MTWGIRIRSPLPERSISHNETRARSLTMFIELLESRRLLADAGNTLATATNIGDLQGQRQFVDSLSTTDLNDFYKFTLPVAGTITALFPATASGTDADLQLVRDANNNGAVDTGEVLASSL